MQQGPIDKGGSPTSGHVQLLGALDDDRRSYTICQCSDESVGQGDEWYHGHCNPNILLYHRALTGDLPAAGSIRTELLIILKLFRRYFRLCVQLNNGKYSGDVIYHTQRSHNGSYRPRQLGQVVIQTFGDGDDAKRP